jgi:hypothetical protein
MSDSTQPHAHPPAGGHWPPREKLPGLVLMAATALATYVCYRLALPFLPM